MAKDRHDGDQQGPVRYEHVDLQVLRKTVIEQLVATKSKPLFGQILNRCTQAGISHRTIHRWLKQPDTQAKRHQVEIVALILRELGHDISHEISHEVAIEKRRDQREKNAASIRNKIDSALNDELILSKESRVVSVLFADLEGSTEYKRSHTELEWLKKMRLHNVIAEECVAPYTGRVVKHLGDGIMVEFDGADHARRAIEAGLAIINAIKEANRKRKYTGSRQLATAVGVATGEVYAIPQQQGEPDPLGSTVDLASRLCDLAGSQELICTNECFDEASLSGPGLNASEEILRFVKGCEDPIPLRLVLPEGRTCGDIRAVGHHSDTRPENVDLLKAARSAIAKKEMQDARATLEKLIKREPGNFEANFRLAEITLNRLSTLSGDSRKDGLHKALRFLDVASEVNPNAWRVWFLASAARRLSFETSGDDGELGLAIEHARTAINKAERFMDTDGANCAKLQLAQLLLVHSDIPETDGATDLGEAAALCHELEYAFNGKQVRRRSDLRVTTAMVALAQGSKPPMEIKKILDVALQEDNRNPRAHRALAKLLESGDGDDPSPV